MDQPIAGASMKAALKFWAKLGFISFGGPAGQIAIMHQEVVERRGWISDGQFLRALNFCMLLPGPEAQQLATYIGWRLNGTLGGILAGALFVIPSVFVMLALSYLAAAHMDILAVRAAFYGIGPVVAAVVAEAFFRMGKKTLKHYLLYGFAGLAFVGIFLFSLPFPYVVLCAAVGGLIFKKRFPRVFCQGHYDETARECLIEEDDKNGFNPKGASVSHVIKIFLVCFGLWAAPVGLLWALRGISDTLTQIALFFTKAAFITFGGAYAVLSYIADIAVARGWLDMTQMLTGLGLAESTPGPLIMVTQYVGFLGAWNLPGGLDPLTAGFLGALITTYVTFLPCFFFIFAGAPFIEAMAGNERLQAALTGVTASVVGVILNLAVWFGYKVIFPQNSLDAFALGILALALGLRLKYQVPVHYLVPLGALCGIIWQVAV